jgi:hypothetical protein
VTKPIIRAAAPEVEPAPTRRFFQLYPSFEHPEEKEVRKLAWVLNQIAEANPGAVLYGAESLRVNFERDLTPEEAKEARLAEARQLLSGAGLDRELLQRLIALLS